MKYQAILFDLDGTLLPMDTDTFVKGYMKLLYQKIAHHNIPPQLFQKAMWAGVAAMTENDGSHTNEDLFWQVFESVTGCGKDAINGECLSFYGGEFHNARPLTGENPLAKQAVALAHRAADKVVLATNPLFPMPGQTTRMSWVGLKPEDFDLVTSYENESFCKPNPLYFTSICRRLGVAPSECLMIGNDENEDAYAATQAGLQVFLVTDCMIARPNRPWNGEKGSFAELIQKLTLSAGKKT